jgi:hypothetical protein
VPEILKIGALTDTAAALAQTQQFWQEIAERR